MKLIWFRLEVMEIKKSRAILPKEPNGKWFTKMGKQCKKLDSFSVYAGGSEPITEQINKNEILLFSRV